jgi:hypothetical protein
MQELSLGFILSCHCITLVEILLATNRVIHHQINILGGRPMRLVITNLLRHFRVVARVFLFH